MKNMLWVAAELNMPSWENIAEGQGDMTLPSWAFQHEGTKLLEGD